MLKKILPATEARPHLERSFGIFSLVAIGINIVVGAGFFVLPGVYFGHVGAWSPWLIALIGIGLLPIGLCFAEVGSRFHETGGPYLYTRAAFGRFVGFSFSWMMWISRIVSHASVISAMVLAVQFLFPGMGDGWTRFAIITGVTSIIAAFNIIGARETALFLNLVTCLKFIPIIAFSVLGLFFVDWSALEPARVPAVSEISAAALVIVFALSGFEMLTIPAGEAKNPSRQLPLALITVIIASVTVMVLANIVAIGILGDPSATATPLAEATSRMIGAAGATLISIAAIIAAIGHNTGSLIAASRILYGTAEQKDTPAFFGRIHKKFHTPVNAIVVTAIAIIAFALSGSYELLAATSAVTRLMIYIGVSAATYRLRHASFKAKVSEATFTPPLANAMPWIAIAVSLVILTGLTMDSLIAGFGAFTVGVLLYILTLYLNSRTTGAKKGLG